MQWGEIILKWHFYLYATLLSSQLPSYCQIDIVVAVLFLTVKNLFSSPGNLVMKTGLSLCGKSTQGKPCSGPVLALYWPCTGLQCGVYYGTL